MKQAIQLLKQVDLLGMITSLVCLVHCVLTPLFFLGDTGHSHSSSIFSFHSLFLILAWTAVISAVRFASTKIRIGLSISIVLLTVGVVFEQVSMGFQWVLYAGSIGLVAMHLLNFKSHHQH